MNVFFFLQLRTKFIRDFYSETSFPFIERKRKIEAEEEPFEPPYSEDGEPPFLQEWMEADEAPDVLGQMCVSMLSSTVQLYLKECINDLHTKYTAEWLQKAGIGPPEEENKAAFKKGWINGNRVYFRDKLRIEWNNAPSNLKPLEEIVLARNKVQHPETITDLHARHWDHDPKNYRRSFFADEDEIKMIVAAPLMDEWFLPRRLNITKERLWQAIEEVEKFCCWLDGELQKWPSQLETHIANLG